MSDDFKIASVEIIPCRLPLREPFVIAYRMQEDIPTIIVRIPNRGWLDRLG